MSTKILFFLNFLIPLPHFGQLSGGALWWWFPELIFFFGPLPSLLPFAPLFHIVTPRWRPLVVDSGTKFFFCRTSILTSFAPLFHIITPRWRPLVVDSGTEFFLAHFHPYSLLQPYFISSRHCCALWWWIPELNHFFRTFPSLFPCHPKFK